MTGRNVVEDMFVKKDKKYLRGNIPKENNYAVKIWK
jgi:hypothetical protein